MFRRVVLDMLTSIPTIKFHPDVLAAHAEFGGDLKVMQKCFDWYYLQEEVARLHCAMQEACERQSGSWIDSYNDASYDKNVAW